MKYAPVVATSLTLAVLACTGCGVTPFTSGDASSGPGPSPVNNTVAVASSANQTSASSRTQRDQSGSNSVGTSGVGGLSGPAGSVQAAPPPPPPPPPMYKLGSSGQKVEQLQIELAETGYLPLTYTPPTGGEPTQLGGRWTWTYPAIPRGLAQLWNPTTFTVLTESAVMTFEQVHGLAVDGIAGPKVLGALMHDLSAHRKSPYGFTFVMVSTHLPEQLELWHNGAVVVKTPVNTGIPASPTVTGTYPVYLQYRSQTMSGVDPSGHPYRDPGVPYVSYFYGGEAVHGFVRSAYGYPQSLGCVELPISAAQQVWPYMHLGTLVQISSASDA